MMVVATAGPGVAGTRRAAGFPGNGVLEVAAAGGPPAGRPRAFAVPDVDQVPELVAGVVGAGVVPVVAAGDRDRFQVDAQVRAAGSRPQPPGPVPAVPAILAVPAVPAVPGVPGLRHSRCSPRLHCSRRLGRVARCRVCGRAAAVPGGRVVPSRVCRVARSAGMAARAGRGPGGPAAGARPAPCAGGPGGAGAAVRGGLPLLIGEGQAPAGGRVRGGLGGHGAGQVRVDGTEPGRFPGPLRQPQQGRQRDGQVDLRHHPHLRSRARARRRGPVRAVPVGRGHRVPPRGAGRPRPGVSRSLGLLRAAVRARRAVPSGRP